MNAMKECYSILLIASIVVYHGVGVTAFTPGVALKTNAVFSKFGYSDPTYSTALDMSTYDSGYYAPSQQASQSGNSGTESRITLSRFLSQYVKDHPEVRTAIEFIKKFWLSFCHLRGNYQTVWMQYFLLLLSRSNLDSFNSH